MDYLTIQLHLNRIMPLDLLKCSSHLSSGCESYPHLQYELIFFNSFIISRLFIEFFILLDKPMPSSLYIRN